MMKVIGFNFKKISIEKKQEITGSVKINTNVEVKSIEFNKIKLFKKGETINFNYEFKIIYEPDFAEIIFEGSIFILMEDNNLMEKIKESWKSKKLLEEIKPQIIDIIFDKCNLKALQLEQDLNLPQHLPVPRFTLQKKDNL